MYEYIDVLVASIDQDENIKVWSFQSAIWLSSAVEALREHPQT